MSRAQSGKLWLVAAALLAVVAGTPAAAHAQNAVLRGMVRSDGGEALAGANVYIVELNLQAATNEAGRFVLTVPGDRVRGQQLQLRVRAIGYRPSSRSVTVAAGEQSVDFTLAADVNRLEEIVVTGVMEGTEQTKVPFTVGRVDAADVPVPSVDPLRMLAGRVPGAFVLSATGRPGASPSVVLRGATSINATGRGQGPLYIVDGVEIVGTLPDIAPSDIENVEVVKGAAAASLYGARAGSGVIQITTRSGRRAADGMSFNFRTEVGANDIERSFPLAQSTSLMLDERDARFCAGSGTAGPLCARTFDWNTEAARVNNEPGDVALTPSGMPLDPNSSIAFGPLGQTFQAHQWPGRTYNAIDQALTAGVFNNNVLDMTGRFNQTQVYASASTTNQEGAFRYLNGYQRYSARLNADQRIGSEWTVALRTYYARSVQDGLEQDNNSSFFLGSGTTFFRLTRVPAEANLLATDTLGRLYVRTNMGTGGVQNENPLYSLQNNSEKQYNDRFVGGGSARFVPTNWLDFEGNVGYDMSTATRRAYRDKGYRVTSSGSTANLGFVGEYTDAARNLNTSFNMTLHPNTGRDLVTRWSLRYSYEQQDFDFRQGSGGTLTSVGVETLNNATTGLSITSQVQSIRGIGYFAGANLDYKSKYIFDGLVRHDGSSLFGADNRWQTFGRYSFAWRPSQESWWFAPSFMNELKLRYSRGTAGGRPNFAAQYETWTISGGVPGFGTLGNENLRPEVTDETEIGADFEIMHRLGVTISHAASLTYNQILLVPNPSEKGFANQWQNAGTMQNRTWEMALNLPVITRRDVSWSWQFTYDHTRTLVRDLYVPPSAYGPNIQGAAAMYFLQAGHPYVEFYGGSFARSCNDLPDMSAIAGGHNFRSECGPGQPFQVNDDGYVVWVGSGHTWQDGITQNLWGTGLNGTTTNNSRSGCVDKTTRQVLGVCDVNADGQITAADNVDIIGPWGVNLNYGQLIGIQDTTCAAHPSPTCPRFQHALGTATPDFQFSVGQNFQYRRLTVYALLQGVIGRSVWNEGRHWSHLDFITADVDQRNKSVETAKPIGYYWRCSPGGPANCIGYGGFYDGLVAGGQFIERASFAKFRELLVSYNVGPVGGVGNWTVSLQGRNLWTITNYHGFDPEVGVGQETRVPGSTSPGLAASAALNGIDAFTFPNTRQLTFALSTSF